ncbi:putative 4-coumarate--CoA ligase [Helianthus anomalus]
MAKDENVEFLFSQLQAAAGQMIGIQNFCLQIEILEISGDHTAALLYSSGTTGVSKGVVLSHMNFIAVSQMLTSDQRLIGGKDYVFLCLLPMFHIFGKYRVTYLWVVPPVFLALAKKEVVNKFDLSSLKQLGSGAAPLGKELMEECAKKLPHVVALQMRAPDNARGIELNRVKEQSIYVQRSAERLVERLNFMKEWYNSRNTTLVDGFNTIKDAFKGGPSKSPGWAGAPPKKKI